MDNRFGNINKFVWMALFQPDKFKDLKSDHLKVKHLVCILKAAHPDIVPDLSSFFYQLNILYNDTQVNAAIGKATDCASLLKVLLTLGLNEALPDVYEALTFLLSKALTSVSCERAFSVMRRVKNYCRSTSKQERTKQLLILSAESNLAHQQSKDPNFCDKIIDMFAEMKSRRIDLIYHH